MVQAYARITTCRVSIVSPAIHWLVLCLPLVGVAIISYTGYLFR